MNTKLGKVQTYSERPPSLKPHDPLITWPTRGYVTISKIYTVARVMTSKPGRVLTFASRFSTQMLKSPLTSRYKLVLYPFGGSH